VVDGGKNIFTHYLPKDILDKSQHFGGFWEKSLRERKIIRWRIFDYFWEGVKN